MVKKILTSTSDCINSGIYDSFKIEGATGRTAVYLIIEIIAYKFSVTYEGTENGERCGMCWCCSNCSAKCGRACSDQKKETDDSLVLRILSIESDEAEILQAAHNREKNIASAAAHFADLSYSDSEDSDSTDTDGSEVD